MHPVVSQDLMTRPEVAALSPRPRSAGALNCPSSTSSYVRSSVDDEDLDSVESHLERLGIEISDDCGRAGIEPT